MKILLVDDDECILNVLTQTLSTSGHHEIVTAESAKSALEAISLSEPLFDLFLVDIQMPEMDGVVLTGLIRKTPGYEHKPIIMVTAMNEKQYLDSAFSAGATDFVTKPFDYHQLLSQIQAAQKSAQDKLHTAKSPFMEGELNGIDGEPKNTRLNQSICIRGVSNAIEYNEFENYILQLSRRRLSKTSVLAVKIGAVERLYAERSEEEFVSLVHKVARAVQETIVKQGGQLCYRGGGVFLCVNAKALKAPRYVVEDTLNTRLSESFSEPKEETIYLFVGDQVLLKTETKAETLQSLSVAVRDAENRNLSVPEALASSQRVLRPRRSGKEEERLELRTYELLLHNALMDCDSSLWQAKLRQRSQRGSNK